MLWLSHHREPEQHRTYALGSVRLCARCLGTYPALAAVLGLLCWLRAPLDWAGDLPVVLLLSLPALLDWCAGRLRPQGGLNAVRTLSGVLLGAALGRSLYVHLQRPLPPVLLAQAALVTALAGPVIVLALWRARGIDPMGSSAVEEEEGARRRP
ncbi:MAG TPA: DUF2085 domain-containing protein [Aggregicoccus sp.]|nr:DUF2085 domain-containing protein [Aggregicoccus sp.]